MFFKCKNYTHFPKKNPKMMSRIARTFFKFNEAAFSDRMKLGAFVGTGIGLNYGMRAVYNGPDIYNTSRFETCVEASVGIGGCSYFGFCIGSCFMALYPFSIIAGVIGTTTVVVANRKKKREIDW